jgi:hypothetical protein
MQLLIVDCIGALVHPLLILESNPMQNDCNHDLPHRAVGLFNYLFSYLFFH